jgi:demethylmenaquinone methyltransferase/2-methoxy-6-polyprenyl-1,4-benzoquinol methylase
MTTGTLEEGQVRAMFDRIAGVYDAMNSVMTAGLHHRWRERAADLARVGPGSRALDVATGTGDLALALSRRGADVVGSDFSEGMLERARDKSAAVRWEQGNALELPYEDDAFDAATVGFGARNFSDLERGLSEMTRVVRPGGRVVVLEITRPTRPPLSTFFSLWFDRVVPQLGRFVGEDQAYSYLPSSVKRFPGPAALAELMHATGLRDVRWILTAGGIIALHSGTVA